MTDAHAAIDRDFDANLERIREFLRIPSVSADDGDLRSTADAVCELIALAGGTAAPREPGEKRPTVIGVIDGPGPTVLRYGMYDVQPPGAQWTVDPFGATLRDGRVVCRGAANSKSALAASILTFASVPSPCRQVFVCEGEEELGSPRLAAFCDAHRDELAGDYALDFDLQEQPGSIFAGVKGLYEIELIAGGGPDMHSSRVAEVPEPAIDLARAVLELKQAVPVANVDLDDRRHARGRQPHRRSGHGARGRRHPLRRALELPTLTNGVGSSSTGVVSGRALGPGQPAGAGARGGTAPPRDGARSRAAWRRGGLRTTCSETSRSRAAVRATPAARTDPTNGPKSRDFVVSCT